MNAMLMTHLRPSFVMLAAFTLLTGLAYPLAMTGIAQGLFPATANGSLIEAQRRVIGSDLIGQAFAGPTYLHPRPSASGYNAAATGATNLGPTSATLIASVADHQAAFTAANGAPGPIDAVTSSGSGLDPHISPENAMTQAARIAAARGVEVAEVQAVIQQATEGPFLGIYGQRRVNVLRVNLALDAAYPAT
jgi:potassium-transporting ATPase KdpC subunit